MVKTSGVIAVTIYNNDGSLFFATNQAYARSFSLTDQDRASQHYFFRQEKVAKQAVLIYTKNIVSIGEQAGFLQIFFNGFPGK